MTLFSQILVLYGLVGAGVAGAAFLAPGSDWFRVLSAIVFWPLYVPILLSRQPTPVQREHCIEHGRPADEMAATIEQVDAELERALTSLDGWAEDVLARERDRIHELRVVWTAQAARIREMDGLLALAQDTSGEDLEGRSIEAASLTDMTERVRNSHLQRRQNVERLRQVRRRAHADLMATLAWVRELVSMIHLAKFTGAPASRAEELVGQIAAAVEGLSGVTWQEEPGSGHSVQAAS
jgi:hypothetical protein